MKRAAIECFEKSYLTRLMAEHQGNISMAALSSGKERRDLGRLLKKYNLNAREFHAAPGSPAGQRAKQV